MKPHTVDQVLASLSRQDCLRGIAMLQHRQNRDGVLQRLLEARLASLTSGNGHAHRDSDELLTVPQVARALKVGLARGYELTRNGDIAAVRIGERQIRVRRSALDEYLVRSR